MKAFYATKLISIVSMVAPSLCSLAQAATCAKSPAGTFSGKAVWKADSGVGFKSAGLTVDSDGAPNSYQVDGNGLSFTCDGVTAIGSTPDTDPKHWQEKCRAGWAKARATGDYSKLRIFGFQTDARNTPLVQKVGDPLPDIGFISTTSVPVSDGPIGTQRHWVDATQIPYVVLSGSFITKFGVSAGDIALVFRPKTGKASFAAYGDGGKLGEASVSYTRISGTIQLSLIVALRVPSEELAIPLSLLCFLATRHIPQLTLRSGAPK